MAFDKAFSFGVLNVSDSVTSASARRGDVLTVGAVIFPGQGADLQNPLALSSEDNNRELDQLKEMGVWSELDRRKLEPRMPAPGALAVYEGRTARILRPGYPDPEGSPARQLMRELGEVPLDKLRSMADRLRPTPPRSAITLEPYALREYTVMVEAPKPGGAFVIRILHTTERRLRIGSYTIVFVPHN